LHRCYTFFFGDRYFYLNWLCALFKTDYGIFGGGAQNLMIFMQFYGPKQGRGIG
jgi:hypothetical protein